MGIEDDAAFKMRGKTDEQGVLRIAVLTRESRILAMQEEMASEEFRVQAHDGRPVLLSLAPGGTMAGRVMDADGRPVESMPWVLAYPDGKPPTKKQMALALSSDERPGSFRLVRASELGTFELHGLSLETTHTLVVGGRGWALPAPSEGNAVGDTELEIVVMKAFAARLKFVEPDGSPVRADDRLWGPMNPMWTWGDRAFVGIGTDSLLAVLMGFPMEDTNRWLNHSSAVVVLLHPDPGVESAGPVNVQGELIGYKTLRASLSLPEHEGRLREIAIPMEPRAHSWGALEIQFVGAEDLPPAGRRTRVQAVGHVLFDSIADGMVYTLDLYSLANGSIALNRLPVGAYDVTLHCEGGFLSYPPRDGRRITVTESGSLATFDIRKAVEIEMLIVTADGSLFSGEVAVEVLYSFADDWGDATFFTSFMSPPYVIQGLLPKTYELRLLRPFLSPEPQQVRAADELGFGRRVSVVIAQ